jgi:hypothetical protein
VCYSKALDFTIDSALEGSVIYDKEILSKDEPSLPDDIF